MKRFALYASVLAAIVLGADGLAKAADVSASDSLPKKAPQPAKESTPATCSTVADFVFTNCQLSWYGITVYGIIDAGVGWQSHGAPFNGTSAVSETYLISKYSNGAHWGIAANGLSQSKLELRAPNSSRRAGISFSTCKPGSILIPCGSPMARRRSLRMAACR
jgi:hypothetical protein